MNKFHIHRFEFKYLINFIQLEKIRSEILDYMDYDPYSLAVEDRSYLVSSLYYDSPDYLNFWEKIDGNKDRKKFRIRTYTLDESKKPYVFLEIKRKKNVVIVKDRALFDYDKFCQIYKKDYYKLLSNGHMPKDQKNVFEEFAFNSIKYNLEPVVCVVYKREAFVGKYHSNIRVTFDKDIRGYKTKSLFPKRVSYRATRPGEVVLELKFSGSLPSWFYEIIRKYNLSKESCSKYCESMIVNNNFVV